MQPKYPVYIISKGRWKSRLTAKALIRRKIPFHVVIEPQEYKQYSQVINSEKILTLPFSNLGKGSIPARNWVWEHSLKLGAQRHWILDDNIRRFFRLHKNMLYRTQSGTSFAVIENFANRYENIALAGMQYGMFVPRTQLRPPFYLNTRIYSIILIDNKLPFRWRGRYNEDTDLSLRVLKSGRCTALFNAFPAAKVATMRMKGGNTKDLYKQNKKMDGRLLMAQSLQKQHPDVAKIVYKWGRWQHFVDYSKFRNNRPILKKGVTFKKKVNNFGMNLIDDKN